MPPHVTLSAERTDWQTPGPFLDLVRSVRPILIDPASAKNNPTQAPIYATQGPHGGGIGEVYDGLRWSWADTAREAYRIGLRGLAFWNPPYGAHLSGPVEPDYRIVRRKPHLIRGAGEQVCIGVGRGWAAKYAAESRAGLESIALVPVRTDAEWWETMMAASSCALLWRSPTLGARISFVDPLTGRAVQGSNLASTVFYAGPEPEKFRAVFSPHGRMIYP